MRPDVGDSRDRQGGENGLDETPPSRVKCHMREIAASEDPDANVDTISAAAASTVLHSRASAEQTADGLRMRSGPVTVLLQAAIQHVSTAVRTGL
jgi:hypothetical protein